MTVSFFTPINMNSQKNHLRHVMLYCFKKSDNANDTIDEICIVYGNAAAIILRSYNWFKRLKTNNFDLKDKDRNG